MYKYHVNEGKRISAVIQVTVAYAFVRILEESAKSETGILNRADCRSGAQSGRTGFFTKNVV